MKVTDINLKSIECITSKSLVISALMLFFSALLLLYYYNGLYIAKKDAIIAIQFAIYLSFISIIILLIGGNYEKQK